MPILAHRLPTNNDQDQLSNHAQLYELSVSHDLCFPQTWMQKAEKNRITHQRPTATWCSWTTPLPPAHGGTWSPASNHFLTRVTLNLHTARHKCNPPAPKPSRRPEPTDIAAFNQRFTEVHPVQQAFQEPSGPSSDATCQEESGASQVSAQQQSIDERWQQFRNTALQSMEHCIPSQDHRPKPPWISQQTWELIERRTAARKRRDREEEQRLHKSIRSQAAMA